MSKPKTIMIDIIDVVFCVHPGLNPLKHIINDNRLPECLAGELVEDCDTCGRKQGVEFCNIREVTGYPKAYHFDCWDNNLKYWQPATKGERYGKTN